MFTMLTSIAYIDIGGYKNTFQYLENTPNYPVLATFWTLKVSVRTFKMLPDNPQKAS